jgi:hypothetical protein
MASSQSKRFCLDTDGQHISKTWPRFITISGEELHKLHAFAILKAIKGMAGDPKNIKRLRNGQLLVEVEVESHSQNLLKTTSLAGVPVKCSPHKSLNTCKGVVRSFESMKLNEAELLDFLAPQGVVEVRQLTSKRGPQPTVTPVLFVTFSGTNLPDSIKVGFEHCKVTRFIPNPLRCFKCQGYGHTSASCKKQQVCASCGSHDHMHDQQNPCQKTPVCVNCKGNHTAYSRDCPVWKKEKEVQTLRVTRGISYPEARKLVFTSTPSYASVVTSKKTAVTIDTGTQTNLTWLGKDHLLVQDKSTTKATQSSTSSTQTALASLEPKLDKSSDITKVQPSPKTKSHTPDLNLRSEDRSRSPKKRADPQTDDSIGDSISDDEPMESLPQQAPGKAKQKRKKRFKLNR